MTNQTTDRLQQDLRQLETGTEAQDIFRLAQARNRALSQTGAKSKLSFLPALGASMASVLLVSFLFIDESQLSLTSDVISDITDQEPAFKFDDENIELYENLDFYYWLAENEQGATG